MKLIKCRQPATCDTCKSAINKGDLYGKRTKSIGSPRKETVEYHDGIPSYVSHGYRYVIKLCTTCAQS
jgi:hypothetical protein